MVTPGSWALPLKVYVAFSISIVASDRSSFYGCGVALPAPVSAKTAVGTALIASMRGSTSVSNFFIELFLPFVLFYLS